MIDGQNDTIVIGLQACAPVFATGSIDDAAEAGEEGSCCNGFQVDWLSEDVRRLLAAHGFTAPDPVDSVARRMVEREVLTPGMPLAAMPVESLYKPWSSAPGNAFGASGEGFVRISYAYSIDEIKGALKRIAHFLETC